MKWHTVHDLGAFVDLGFRLRLMSQVKINVSYNSAQITHKSKFKSGTVEKNSSTKNVGPPPGIECTCLR